MATQKSPTPALSPSVSAVFEDFLANAEKDKEIDKEASARLRDTLLKKQLFDQDNIRRAIFGDEEL